MLAVSPLFGTVVGYLAYWALAALSRRRQRCPRRASWEERVSLLRAAISGSEPRWLDTDEIGLPPLAIDDICTRSGWRVVRAYELSPGSWLQFAVPPGRGGSLRAAEQDLPGARLGRGGWTLVGLGLGVVLAVVVSRTGLEAFAGALGIGAAFGIPASQFRKYWSRPRQWMWVIGRFRGAQVRYNVVSTSLPRHAVHRLAADLGYELRSTTRERYGYSDVFGRLGL